MSTNRLLFLFPFSAPNTVELIEQKDFFRSKNVKCESDPYTEAVRTIQAASVSQCQAECLTGRDSCVAFTFDQTDKTNSQCYLWSRTCTSKELIGPTPNIDYYVSSD